MKPDSGKKYNIEDCRELSRQYIDEFIDYLRLSSPIFSNLKELSPSKLPEQPEQQINNYNIVNITYNAAPPIKPANSKPKPSNPADELTGKSKNTYLNLIKALCLLIARYETKQPKPKYFENRKIVLNNGRISAEALRELLQAIDPDTPERAEQLIKKAMKLTDE